LHQPRFFILFGIETLVSFLNQSDPDALAKQLAPFGVTVADLAQLDGLMSKQAWLGAAERIVFDAFRRCADYVSPFSIHNPQGWRYWLIHFANRYAHAKSTTTSYIRTAVSQAHFGRSGLHMLAYDPSEADSIVVRVLMRRACPS